MVMSLSEFSSKQIVVTIRTNSRCFYHRLCRFHSDSNAKRGCKPACVHSDLYPFSHWRNKSL